MDTQSVTPAPPTAPTPAQGNAPNRLYLKSSPECEPSRRIGIEHEQSAVSSEEERRLRNLRMQWPSWWRDSGVPSLHRDRMDVAAEDGGPWGKEYAKARDALERSTLFVMLGNRGTGKTQMAVNLLRDLCKRNKQPAYRVAPDVYAEIRASFDDEGRGTEHAIIQRLIAFGALALDELNEGKWSEFESRIITGIVDRRYARQRHTILISNFTIEQFFQVAGASITSRCEEVGHVIDFNWRSFRSGIWSNAR